MDVYYILNKKSHSGLTAFCWRGQYSSELNVIDSRSEFQKYLVEIVCALARGAINN
jgi:hypothetical protein